MSRSFNGTSDKGVISSALLTSLASTAAFHIDVWAKSDSATALQFVFGVGSTTDNDPVVVIGLDGTSSGDKMYSLVRDNTPSAGAAVFYTGNGYSTATWHNLQFSNRAVDARLSWLDANEASQGAQTVSQSATFSPDRTAIGCLQRAAASGFFDGLLARLTIWRSGTVTDLPSAVDRWLLAHGADPGEIKSSAIVYQWDDDLAAVVGGQSFTWTGTSTDADNPASDTTQVVAATVADWEVPGGGSGSAGFTNTGLGWDSDNSELLIGDYTNTRIVRADTDGTYIGEIVLGGSAPSSSVQGVAWDSSDGTYWVCHYAATNGTIRRYNSSGTLLQTISPAIGNAGPCGCAYDAADDRILAVWENGTVRGFDCADGSLDETVSLTLMTGHLTDGLAIDPLDSDVLWVSLDTTTSTDYIAKYSRSTGAMQWIMYGPQDPESLVFIDGTLWMCADQEFHSAITDGNRVRQMDVTVGGASYTLEITSGSYALTGSNVGLNAARSLAITSGSYSKTGSDVGLNASRRVSITAGSYSLTGSDVTLTKSAANSLVITGGSYSLTGSDVVISADRVLAITSGSYSLSGSDVTLTKTAAGVSLAITSGVYALTGSSVGLSWAHSLAITSGSYALSGFPITLTYSGAAADVAYPLKGLSQSSVLTGSQTFPLFGLTQD